MDTVRSNDKLFRPKMTEAKPKMERTEISRVIKPFTGEGDIMAWLSKITLVATLSGMKDVDLATLIPLYLEGGALAVYLEMSEEEKSNTNKLKKGLLRAFADSPFTAFSKLME